MAVDLPLPPILVPRRKLVLHIEHSKTGSTAIQDALALDHAPCVPDPQPTEASAWHGPETLRLVHAFADMLAHVMEAGPKPLLHAIQPAWAR